MSKNPDGSDKDFGTPVMGADENGKLYHLPLSTDGTNKFLDVNLAGKFDTNNSTNTPLNSGQTFTGVGTDISDYAAISILIYTDVNSANDGLVVEFGPDGSDWHPGEHYTIPADSTKFFTPPVQAKYFRVVYTNNGDNQTTFHVHTMLKKTPIKWSSHNLKDNLNDDDDAELNISVLKLRTAQNTYTSGAATNSGNFKVSIEEFDDSLTGYFNPTAGYSINDIDESGTPVSYFGFERSDGYWYILKEDATTSTNPTYRYAVGTSGYTTAWSGRTAQSYDYFGSKF